MGHLPELLTIEPQQHAILIVGVENVQCSQRDSGALEARKHDFVSQVLKAVRTQHWARRRDDSADDRRDCRRKTWRLRFKDFG